MSRLIDNKTTGLITASEYKKTSVKITYWAIFSFLVIAALIAVLPVLWAFLSSFKTLEEFYSPDFSFFPKRLDLSKITHIWKELRLGRSFINSMIMIAGSLVGDIVGCGLAGYVLSRLKPKGSRIAFILITWTMMMPTTVSLVPLFLMFVDIPFLHINLQNTYIPFWMGALSNCFHIILFKSFFESIPKSYIEASRIDGCSNFGIFTRIIVPLSKPIIITSSIFTFNNTWNNFLMPYLLLKDDSLHTVALRLYTTTIWPEPDKLLASFIVLIPPLLVFIIFSKQIMNNSLNVGVKE